MSATVVRQPEAWIKSMGRLKADIVAGRDDADLLTPNLKIGVSTNFNKLVSQSGHLKTREQAASKSWQDHGAHLMQVHTHTRL
jgi:hypothetical protein